jgi:hypothetical protein
VIAEAGRSLLILVALWCSDRYKTDYIRGASSSFKSYFKMDESRGSGQNSSLTALVVTSIKGSISQLHVNDLIHSRAVRLSFVRVNPRFPRSNRLVCVMSGNFLFVCFLDTAQRRPVANAHPISQWFVTRARTSLAGRNLILG